MEVSYKKLWKLLIDKDMKKKDLQALSGISWSSMTKLSKGETVSMEISNAVCHRSYVSPGSIQVAIYDDRLEVTSPGRISPDLTMEQLKAGNSRVRNVAIGAAFQYMHIIEKWGTGIPRILKEAAEYGLREPELKDFGTSFRINIFRKPFETDLFGVVNPSAEKIEGQKESLGDNVPQNVPQNDSQNVPQRIDRLADAIIAAINKNPHVTRAEMASQAGVTIKTISRKLNARRASRCCSRRRRSCRAPSPTGGRARSSNR